MPKIFLRVTYIGKKKKKQYIWTDFLEVSVGLLK